MTISLIRANKLIEELKDREISHGRDPATWYFYENHVYGTAKIAKMIASEIKTMDPDKLYLMGLLHDISKTNFYEFYDRNVKNEAGEWIKVREGGRRRGQQRMRWFGASLTQWT